MSLSGWWSGAADRKMEKADPTVRLALALGSIRSIIRVVDRSVPKMSVNWATEVEQGDGEAVSMSYTDFKGGAIHINPLPITKVVLPVADALDICVFFGLHEAGHSQESRSRYADLFDRDANGQEVPAFEPMRVAAYLWNVAEDIRSESATIRNWEGFEPYFDKGLAWMWDEFIKSGLTAGIKNADLVQRLRIVWLACRYPDKALATQSIPNTKEDRAEVAWWVAWQADYLAEQATTKETIQRGLDHLAEDKSTRKEMQKMAEQEAAERARGEKIRAQLDRLMREGIKGTYGVCITNEGEVVPLDEETAAEVDKLVREGLIEHKTIINTVGAATPVIRVRRPEENAQSRRAYIGKPNATSAALRTALVFRNSAPQHDVKLLKSGTLDDEELYRWAMGDYRVFSERIVESKPDAYLGLLVDLSGSMSGRKLQIAQNLAQLLVWAVHDQEGVETGVWGHTTGHDDEACEVYRIWQRGDPMSRLGLISTLPHMSNYDGHAVSMVVREMMDKEQPVKQLIVLSDGLPSGAGYGGKPAAQHVRAVVAWAKRHDINVLQLAIDPDDIRPAEQEELYGPGNWMPFKSIEALPRQLTQVMSRFL